MTVVLWDINVKKRLDSSLVSTPETEERMLSLNDYYEIARRCIAAFAFGSIRNMMIKSEDAVSFVAEHLMYATCRWDKERGRTFHSYLNYCSICAIKRWALMSRRASCQHDVSLNASFDENSSDFYSTMTDNTDTPVDKLCHDEETASIRKIMDEELTEKQRNCIEMIYINGCSGADVARALGISRQAVDQCTRKGLTKIRTILNDKQIPT